MCCVNGYEGKGISESERGRKKNDSPGVSGGRRFVILRSHEALHQVVCPSVLPCLGTLAYYLRRVTAELLVDSGMAGEAQTFQPLKSAVDGQAAHLVFGSGSLDGNYMMNASGTGDDTMLHALLAQPSGAPEFRNAQLLPLAAVVDVAFVLRHLRRYTSPVSLMLLLHCLLVLYRLR